MVEIEESEVLDNCAQNEAGFGLVVAVAPVVLAKTDFDHEPHEAE